MSGQTAFHIHLVSDSTGDTVAAVTKAGASLFPGLVLQWHRHPFVRSAAALDPLFAAIAAVPGPVFHTMVDRSVIAGLRERATALGVECVDVLTPAVRVFAALAGNEAVARPGSQHRLDDQYLDRVSALDYAMTHDDGLSAAHLKRADVILIGVSRTSKTPTCIFLAYQGLRAANVPLLANRPVPEGLFVARAAGVPVIGLTATPQRLAQIRKHRRRDPEGEPGPYADIEHIRREVTEARLFFEQYAIPVVDVTRRSIEETAATIRFLVDRGGESS